ncbi:MAG: hypothetical protein WBI17_09115 [Clostridiaceae bacterium]
MKKAIYINPRDSVATVTEDVASGEFVEYIMNGEIIRIQAIQAIPAFHKIAVNKVEQGLPVYKYGEEIGIASLEIKAGEHVDVLNIESVRA